MMTTHPFNALAIGQYTQALNNRLNCYFDGINAIQKVKSFFLVGNNSSFQSKKPISVETSVKVRTKYAVKTVFLMRTNHCMGCFLKSRFIESIKRSHKKLNYYALGMIPRDCNSFLKTLLIQVAKLVSPSFIASSSNCCRNSSVNRIWYCGDLFSFGVDMVITQYYYNYMVTTIVMVAPQKTIAQRVHTSMSYLTTNIKWSNAMANSNDTLRPKNGQPDLSNLISVLNLYQADIPTHHLLQAENHFEELQQSILYGIGAIGNLMFWASENESYSEQNLKSDMRDIGYLLAQLRDVACFASNQINLLDATQNHKGGK
ncbi:hypothetical protein [Gilliamella apicola]|uniref:hypothetical protein n=2 Tax=Gilliamella apicola TaxID=1196095 RepID=UPI0015E8898D|nr:hypothetical protein [Gilliamella apicola]